MERRTCVIVNLKVTSDRRLKERRVIISNWEEIGVTMGLRVFSIKKVLICEKNTQTSILYWLGKQMDSIIINAEK